MPTITFLDGPAEGLRIDLVTDPPHGLAVIVDDGRARIAEPKALGAAAYRLEAITPPGNAAYRAVVEGRAPRETRYGGADEDFTFERPPSASAS